jgi:tRNA(Ile)-lysidine synthase
MPKYIVAVSGGVDSVVLLHMLHQLGSHQLIVAHVDHGIREESASDAAFVRKLAESYDIPFYLSEHTLGPEASEETARNIRYDFLRQLAKEHAAAIMTAHHADDVVETIAINLHRGTGWRGLATHDSDSVRPLLSLSKKRLYAYAKRHNLEWREDWTNESNQYLRNRFRKQLVVLSDDSRDAFLQLRKRQLELKQAIAEEVLTLIGSGSYFSRYFFTNAPPVVAQECLRYITEGKLTRPQLEKLLLAIKTTAPGKKIEPGNGITVHFTTRNFSLSLIK